jgi:hypothetical protein
MRVQQRPAISVRMTAPSGITTGPSGKPKLLATMRMSGMVFPLRWFRLSLIEGRPMEIASSLRSSQ